MSGRWCTCEAYKNEWRHLSRLIFKNINQSLVNGEFPHYLKQAEVIPVFKNKEKLDRSNNRPVSYLPVISKIYKRLMYDQMFNILIKPSLNFNVVFVKDLAFQNSLLYMIKTWEESSDQGSHYHASESIWLLKAFDCMMHDLLIVKLQAYGFDNDFLKFICNYLLDRRQKSKRKLSFSTWSKIEYAVLQGFILGPLLFNINILDMFFEQKDVNFAAYADHNTRYCFDKNLEVLHSKFQICALKPLEWFSNNYMQMNSDKWHLILVLMMKVSK